MRALETEKAMERCSHGCILGGPGGRCVIQNVLCLLQNSFELLQSTNTTCTVLNSYRRAVRLHIQRFGCIGQIIVTVMERGSAPEDGRVEDFLRTAVMFRGHRSHTSRLGDVCCSLHFYSHLQYLRGVVNCFDPRAWTEASRKLKNVLERAPWSFGTHKYVSESLSDSTQSRVLQFSQTCLRFDLI